MTERCISDSESNNGVMMSSRLQLILVFRIVYLQCVAAKRPTAVALLIDSDEREQLFWLVSDRISTNLRAQTGPSVL